MAGGRIHVDLTLTAAAASPAWPPPAAAAARRRPPQPAAETDGWLAGIIVSSGEDPVGAAHVTVLSP